MWVWSLAVSGKVCPSIRHKEGRQRHPPAEAFEARSDLALMLRMWADAETLCKHMAVETRPGSPDRSPAQGLDAR